MLVFAVALLVAPGAAARSHRQATRSQVLSAASLGRALRSDGSLRNVTGSFNARGYRLVLGPHGTPRFVRAADASGPTLTAASAPTTAAATTTLTGDALWSENFGDVGFGASANFGINAVAVSGGKVYVGGAFHTFGWLSTVNYNNVAMWDGHGWHPLGSGTSGGTNSGQVNAIAVLGRDVYVGGEFATAGGITANDIAKWNSTTGWSALGTGVGGGCCSVNAIAATGTSATPTVYAGGDFSTIGGTAAGDIGVWNGTAWSALGSGLTASANQVNALLLVGTTLYAGGNFAKSGTTSINSLASWNGSAWSPVGGAGISTGSGSPATVNSLAYNAATSTLYVGGSFAEVGGTFSFGTASGATPASNVASYNGTWDTLGGGIATSVRGVAWWSGKLFASYVASSTPTIAQWDGTAWSPLAAPLTGVGSPGPTLVATAGGVIAAGQYTGASTSVLNEIGLWNGAKWLAYGLGVPGQINALAASNHDLYAVGGFTNAGSTPATNIAHFNGTTWVNMGTTGNAGSGGSCAAAGVTNNICAVAVDPVTHHVFIGGGFTSINGVAANNVAMWDGSAWHNLGQGVNGTVEALLVYGGKLYAGGTFTTADGNPADLVAQWDSATGSWSALGDNVSFLTGGGSNGFVNALAGVNYSPYTHDILIGGGFTAISDGTISTQTNGLVMFDTGTTYPSPTSGYYYFTGNNGGSAGVIGVVYALYTAGRKLYIGGSFSTAGGLPATGFAVFDLGNTTNTGWSVPGTLSGSGASVYALSGAGGTGPGVYLAGSFSGAGGVTTNNIAQYTPGATTPWAGLGSGLNASSVPNVFALAPSADGVYAGGRIGMAGASTPAAGLALWTATALKLSVTNVASPSPTSAGTNTTFTATVNNTGTASASGVTLTSTVPVNATYVSATPSQGNCSLTGSTIKCTLGSLGAQGSGTDTATVAIVLDPTTSGTTLTDRVKAGQAGTSFSNSAKAVDQVN